MEQSEHDRNASRQNDVRRFVAAPLCSFDLEGWEYLQHYRRIQSQSHSSHSNFFLHLAAKATTKTTTTATITNTTTTGTNTT